MKILAFDTCLDKMYVALGENDKILNSKIVETTSTHYHSAFLISTIRDILKENNLTPQDVEIVATNIGPGSFTGIRACTTVARVFAQGENIKAVGISSLEILSRINTTQKQALVALDARKEMAYVGIFEGEKQILAPKAILLSELKEMIADGDYFVITDDKLQAILGGISYQQQDNDFGECLIQIASARVNNSQNDAETDWRKLHPLYIQPPALNIKPKM